MKESKIPNYWSSTVPKKYKRNAIQGDVQRVHKISSNFEIKKQCIKKKYLSINFSCNFIEPTFNSYQQKYKSLIPNWLCEKKNNRKTIYIRISFCQSNGQYSLSLSENQKLSEVFTKENGYKCYNLENKKRNIIF